jgi:molybdopterin-containing oxidoreductase family iron-sulfur binding subunit
MEKKYWKGLEELNNDPEFVRLKNDEFFELIPIREEDFKSEGTTPRRDFLKYLGFGVAAASLAACTAPVRKAIPYLIKPEEITPGVPDYYASTHFDGHDYASVVVKTREGRPIKIEGNELSKITGSGSNARVQASVLNLYDSARLKAPLASKNPASWTKVDGEIKSKLADVSSKQGKIRILSSTIISPSTKKVIADFTVKYPTTKHIQYDAISRYGMLKANQLSFGKAVLPVYSFQNASVIVGFECDFLANWIAPINHARQYAMSRKLSEEKKDMSRHIQFEANVSLTGSNADSRYKLRASEHGTALVSLYNMIASMAGAASVSGGKTSADEALNKTAKELWANKGKAIVVSGSNDVNDQVVVNGINFLLGSYENLIDLDRACNIRQGNDEEVMELVREMNAGEVGALIIYNSNPVYTLPGGNDFANALKKVGLTVSFADREDETAANCNYVCPDNHYLESWNDAEPVNGSYSTCQPTIQKLFDTRQAQESLLVWSDAPVQDYHEYLKANWEKNILAGGTGAAFMKVLQDGIFESAAVAKTAVAFNGNISEAASKISEKKGNGVDIVLYEKTGIGNGANANNPWQQELPDPVTRICWDNYFSVSVGYAKAKGYKNGNVLELKAGNVSVKGPVLIQPGQADETVGVALGYGRTHAGKAGNNVGKNAYPFAVYENGSIHYTLSGATLNKTVDPDYTLAGTQTHHTMMGREPVKETTLAAWQKDHKSGNEVELIQTYKGKLPADQVDLWATEKQPGFEMTNHHWGMVVDLSSCIGCGSCVVGCTAENNVPVVGKEEIGRSREMHWIRIDRYYSSDLTKEIAEEKGIGKIDAWRQMENPSDNPQVVFQPVMCQHCNHAPCETVCPVSATPHSSEGLNMMAYNRCVGTRYCENNCPYKVRRFNWFRYNENPEYPFNQYDELGKMVLNPDVVVRSRGVMEKCSLCVQRIQYGKLEAKKQERRPVDGEIKTACQQACPTNAITFGDYNDSKGEISKMAKDERSYHLLEELNTQPNVYYQVKVRNV